MKTHERERVVIYYADNASNNKEKHSKGIRHLETEFWTVEDGVFQSISEKEGKENILLKNKEYYIVDLTEAFSFMQSGEITTDDMKNYIKGLIGKVFNTTTKPLQIQISNKNKAHVVQSNVKEGLAKVRHD